jgi:hypothetical protein
MALEERHDARTLVHPECDVIESLRLHVQGTLSTPGGSPKRRARPPDAPGAYSARSYPELRLEREALRDRVAEPEREDVFRAVARPPFAPAFFTDALRLREELVFRAPPLLRADDLRAELVLRPELDFFLALLVLRAPVLRADVLRDELVFFREPPVLRAEDLRAELVFRAPPVLRADDLRAELVLRAPPVLRADDLRAELVFRAPPVLRADVLRAVVLRAVVLRADDLRAELVFRAPPVLRLDVLRAAVLRVELVLLAVLRAELVLRPVLFLRDDPVLRLEPPDLLREDPERELLLDERDEERVVAGTATARAASAPSSIDASPMAESPHVSSAASLPIDVSLSESALDVSASPVPLQSSSVINDLLSWIARARFPTTLLSNVQCGRHTSSARCWKGKHNVRTA